MGGSHEASSDYCVCDPQQCVHFVTHTSSGSVLFLTTYAEENKTTTLLMMPQ